MVEEKQYYTKFKELKDENLLKYFSNLDTKDWSDFFDDYFNHRTNYLVKILVTPKGEDIYSYGLMLIQDLDPQPKSSIVEAINSLLSSYYTNKNFNLFKIVFDAIRYLELNVDSGVLTEIIQSSTIEKNIREVAAITLSVVYQNSLIPFWDKLDLKKDVFLIPSYIGFFKRLNPIKGIQKLSILTSKPESTFAFIAPVKSSLSQILISPSDLAEFARMEDNFPSWVREFIGELTQDYTELNDFSKKLKRIKQGIYKSTRKLKKVKLYRSIFADMIIIDLMKEMGCFEDVGIDLEIEFTPWNKIFDTLLKGDNFDIIIGNERVFEYRNSLSPVGAKMFTSWNDLIKYEGFAIVSKDKTLNNFKHFLDIAANYQSEDTYSDEQKKTALKSLLEQLKTHKIVAANNTDYYFTLKSLIEENGLKLRDFDIKSDKDPYDGFLEFLSHKELSVYIGSANLNQKALASNCIELISEKHFDFNAVQYNSIITKNITHSPDLHTEQNELILKFFAAYTIGRTKIQDHKDVYLAQWFDMYNQQMKINYSKDYDKFTISKNDFDEIVLNVVEYTPVLKHENEVQNISSSVDVKSKKKN